MTRPSWRRPSKNFVVHSMIFGIKKKKLKKIHNRLFTVWWPVFCGCTCRAARLATTNARDPFNRTFNDNNNNLFVIWNLRGAVFELLSTAVVSAAKYYYCAIEVYRQGCLFIIIIVIIYYRGIGKSLVAVSIHPPPPTVDFKRTHISVIIFIYFVWTKLEYDSASGNSSSSGSIDGGGDSESPWKIIKTVRRDINASKRRGGQYSEELIFRQPRDLLIASRVCIIIVIKNCSGRAGKQYNGH